ncbi:hypothetical protein KC19_8G037600 [Ceratodon purpureus]|uniref:Uncharacterized protein n=1 Tax=Ceratodon purpureus TaxID=3225 RepID=A0A8T0GX87_CERPU|nr:hypothetical protein KC19_8G037600 [Ceratodon purpureus]
MGATARWLFPERAPPGQVGALAESLAEGKDWIRCRIQAAHRPLILLIFFSHFQTSASLRRLPNSTTSHAHLASLTISHQSLDPLSELTHESSRRWSTLQRRIHS